MITGAVGRAALKNHESDGGSLMSFESHVTLCVLCGIITFVLLSISLLLGCGKQFIPEFMLVYSIRNLIMCILFTGNLKKYTSDTGLILQIGIKGRHLLLSRPGFNTRRSRLFIIK